MDKYCVGIDIDKKGFKACISLSASGVIKVKSSRSFSNQQTGFKELLAWSAKHHKDKNAGFCVVLEATGVYHEALAYFLASNEVQVHIVLASRAKHYLRSLGHRSKTDKLDAKGLSYMGCQQELAVWQMPDKAMMELRSLTRQIEALQSQKTILKNQLEALSHSSVVHKESLRSNERVLALLEKEASRLRQEVEKLVQASELLSSKYAHFSSLKGIGLMSFAVIASETNGFALFNSQKQVTCYAGYDVVENQSGQRSGKTKISKKGNSHIRRILHMAAWSAVSHKVAPFHQLYERVYERTGIKMKAYVAVQRKLLAMAYTLWKKDEAFEADFQKKQGQAPSIDEPKASFRGDEIAIEQKTATPREAAALDKPPCNQVA